MLTNKLAILKNKLFILTILLLTGGLYSCQQSDELVLDYDVHPGAHWNQEHNKIAFIASTRAYKRPQGLDKFPDGGSPKYLSLDVSLYIYQSETLSLNKIVSFNELLTMISVSRINWQSKTFIRDSMVYFHVSPLRKWENLALESRENIDIQGFKKKYENYYVFNINSEEISEVEPQNFHSMYQKQKDKEIGLSEIYAELAEVPIAEWGMRVQEILPKSRYEYVSETIYLKNECQLTRRAVIEQIIAEMEPDKIEALISDMDAYKKQLEGLKQKEYEIYSQKTYQKLQRLVDTKHSESVAPQPIPSVSSSGAEPKLD